MKLEVFEVGVKGQRCRSQVNSKPFTKTRCSRQDIKSTLQNAHNTSFAYHKRSKINLVMQNEHQAKK